MSMIEELNFFLELQIKQNEEKNLHQLNKIHKKILKKFEMETLRPLGTPMSPSCKLDKDEKSKKVDNKLYRGIIGYLLYLTVSRSDIMFSICMCARYQSDLRKSHLLAV